MEYEFTLANRRSAAQETTEISLAPSTGSNLKFIAGQNVELTIPDPIYEDDLGSRRTFSIASAPSEPILRFAYRESPSGWKRSLAALPLGAIIKVQGPYGNFTLPQSTETVLAIAGGIGVTPFLSMIRSRPTQTFNLLYANSSPERAAFLEELQTSAQAGVCTLWEHWGVLTSEVVQNYLTQSPPALIYIAGPVKFTALAIQAATSGGFPREKVLVEQFTGY